MFWTAASFVAQSDSLHSPPDARIIVIDADLYTNLVSEGRSHVIDVMLRDIQNFDMQFGAEVEVRSVVLLKYNDKVELLVDSNGNPVTANELSEHPILNKLRAGNVGGHPGIDVLLLRNEILPLIDHFNLYQRNASGDRQVVILHLFAQNFFAQKLTERADLHKHRVPVACTVLEYPNPSPWPESSILAVEFRPPVNGRAPNQEATSGVLAIFASWRMSGENIRFLGVKGPYCRVENPESKPGLYESPHIPSNDSDCLRETVTDLEPIVQACLPDVPAVESRGRGLDSRPITMILREDLIPVAELAFEVEPAIPGYSAMVTIGRLRLDPGDKRVVKGAGFTGRHEAYLKLTALESCSPIPGTIARISVLGDGEGLFSVIISELTCADTTIRLGTLDLQ